MKIIVDGLVQVRSVFDPKIRIIREAVNETGRSRQFILSRKLTFGVITGLNIKVIIVDDKYNAFVEKCKVIDKKKKK
jgi:hypothetical protein